MQAARWEPSETDMQHCCFGDEARGKFARWMQKTASDDHQNAQVPNQDAVEGEDGEALV